jgi:integrase/recombinase XerD
MRHPYISEKSTVLSPHTVSAYLRSIRASWNCWQAEDLVMANPFDKVRVPGVPNKVMLTISENQLTAIFKTINTKTAEGFRDNALLNTYLDTICRLSEITNLQMTEVDLAARRLKVMGKGRRECYVYFGMNVQKLLWRYVHLYRPVPQLPTHDNLFLTHDGRPLSKNRVEAIVKKYATRAGIIGVRLSPHTLLHTTCFLWVRNGGDLFSLQAITGHSSLNVLQNYVNLNSDDISRAHGRYSPVDNLRLS